MNKITAPENLTTPQEKVHGIKLFDWSSNNSELSVPDSTLFLTLTTDEKRMISGIMGKVFETPTSTCTKAGNMKLYFINHTKKQLYSTMIYECRPKIISIIYGIIAHTTRVEKDLAEFDIATLSNHGIPKTGSYSNYLTTYTSVEDSKYKICIPKDTDNQWLAKRYVDTYIESLIKQIQLQTLEKKLSACKSSLKDYISKSNIWTYYDETYPNIWDQLKTLQLESQSSVLEPFDLENARKIIESIQEKFVNNGNLTKNELKEMLAQLDAIYLTQNTNFRLSRIKNSLIEDINFRLKSYKKK